MAPGAAHTNGNTSELNTNNHASEGATSNDSDVATFWNRYEHVKCGDVMKNVLIEDVISRYEYLNRTHNEYVEQHKQEREYLQNAVEREQGLQTKIMHLQRLLNRDPYILVLIDGDGMIFSERFLRQGDTGGKQAAAMLHSYVTEWASQNVVDYPRDAKIVVRVYANVKGLSETCTKAGLVDAPFKVEDFVRGFTRGKTLFDFTDVGAGKDRADGKMNEMFKLFIYDYHCRQILFGCSHDNGFARLLEEYTDDMEVKPRLTLLEGVPFEKELATLPFATTKFADLFRDTKIGVPGQLDLLTGPPRPRVDYKGLNAASSVFTPRTATPASSTYSPYRDISNLDGAVGAVRNIHLRENSVASSGDSSDVASTGMWSTVASKNAHKPLTELPRPPSEPANSVKRNRKGQRLDSELEYDHDEVHRIKKLKSCNQHYIGVGCCHWNAGKGDKCPHNHEYKFTATELKWLRVCARETPCKKGHDCDDPKCIYGHHCPFPIATEGSMRGVGCLNGDACRFPRSMHGMDMTPVKMIKVSGAF